MQIDSTTRNEELIEQQFLSLEQPDNEIEIVIHVNMLKEGWDVTNLYTIVPLRAANAGIIVTPGTVAETASYGENKIPDTNTVVVVEVDAPAVIK